MKRNQTLLHIRSRPHFLCAAEKDANFARVHRTKQSQFCMVGIVILDEGNFRLWQAALHQFFGHVIVNGEALVLWRGKVAEDELRQATLFARLPNAVNIFDGHVDLALRVVLGRWQHQPQIERRLASLARNFEHIIFRRINALGF